MSRLKIMLPFILLISAIPAFASIRSLKSFGAKGDGITDDSEAILKALLFCQNGIEINGEDLTYLVEKPIKASVKQLRLINCKFIAGKSYSRQGNFNLICNDISLQSISVDGGRGTYVTDIERWKVFSTENKIKSICPDRPDYFHFYAMDKAATIEIKNFNVKNLNALSALTIYTLGTVKMKNLVFNNLSYKTFHVYHSIDDGKTTGGETFVENAFAKDIGILPPKLLIKGRYYFRDSIQMMPQGSFNFIVSFGNYTATNVKVENYGSTGMTADRNINFVADKISIVNNTNLTFSNNPSGGMWLENCKNATIKNIKIKISKRDKRDLNFDSSGMHIFSVNGKVTIDSLSIESTGQSCLNKGLRASLAGTNMISIGNFTLSGNFKQDGAHFAILDNAVLSTINIGQVNLFSPSMSFYGIKNINIGHLNGKYGREIVRFALPVLNGNNESYKIKTTNLKSIIIDKNVKEITINRNGKTPVLEVID